MATTKLGRLLQDFLEQAEPSPIVLTEEHRTFFDRYRKPKDPVRILIDSYFSEATTEAVMKVIKDMYESRTATKFAHVIMPRPAEFSVEASRAEKYHQVIGELWRRQGKRKGRVP